MLTTKPNFSNTDGYIAQFPNEIQERLQQLRITIARAAPGAEEVISYKMPAFRLNGMLVWFAAYKDHIGLYPTASPITAFRDRLVKYKTSKGAIQFPIDKPLPLALVKDIVKFRVAENGKKTKAKNKTAARKSG